MKRPPSMYVPVGVACVWPPAGKSAWGHRRRKAKKAHPDWVTEPMPAGVPHVLVERGGRL